jgi:hypothetical protein
MNNYWQTETPVVATSAKNVLRWFPKAGRLQAALPDWRGNTRRAKIFRRNDSSRQEMSPSGWKDKTDYACSDFVSSRLLHRSNNHLTTPQPTKLASP